MTDFSFFLKDIYLYLKKPLYDRPLRFNSTKEKIIFFVQLYFFTSILQIISNIICTIFIKLGAYDKIEPYLNVIINHGSKIDAKSQMLAILFLIPIYEELCYRLSLTKFNINFLSISISLILSVQIHSLIGYLLWYPKLFFIGPLISFVYNFAIAIPLIFIFRIIFKRLSYYNGNIEGFWEKYYVYAFYITTITYALIHIKHLANNSWVFLPIIILPYLVYGLILGYVRNKMGILYSILMHFSFNFIPIIYYIAII